MAFDPDKYLADSAGGFDPDAYLGDAPKAGKGDVQAAPPDPNAPLPGETPAATAVRTFKSDLAPGSRVDKVAARAIGGAVMPVKHSPLAWLLSKITGGKSDDYNAEGGLYAVDPFAHNTPRLPDESPKDYALRTFKQHLGGVDDVMPLLGLVMTNQKIVGPGAVPPKPLPGTATMDNAAARLAGEKSYKAIGGIQSDIKSPISGSGVLGGTERAAQAGLDLQDLGVSTPLVRPRTAVERIQVQKGEVGQQLGKVLPDLDTKLAAAGRTADPAVTVDLNRILQRVDQEIVQPLRASKVEELVRAADDVENQALAFASRGDVAANGTMNLADAHQLRMDFDKALFHNNKNPLMSTLSNQEKFGLRDILDDEIGQKVDAASRAVSGGADGAEWARLNRLYASLKIGEKAAAAGTRRAAGNSAFGLREAQMAAGGLATGDMGTAAAAATGMKLARTYGPGLTASAARAASKIPEALRGAPPAPELYPNLAAYLSDALRIKLGLRPVGADEGEQ